jgi:hypothetical protein
MSTTTDSQVQKLFAIVQQKKSEIAKIEKPNWLTNCSFRMDENNPTTSINIQVVNDPAILVTAFAKLNTLSDECKKAAIELGVDGYKFSYCGFGFDDWKSDFQTRINKIQITKKKNELTSLENRLNSLISPELRTAMELKEIEKELGID